MHHDDHGYDDEEGDEGDEGEEGDEGDEDDEEYDEDEYDDDEDEEEVRFRAQRRSLELELTWIAFLLLVRR